MTRSHEVRQFTAIGQPAPQGSKAAFVNKHTGRAQMLESSKVRVDAWRSDVKSAALNTFGHLPPMDGPVEVTIYFQQARPKAHYRTGRNAHLLKDSAPDYPTGRPDVDKLVRSTLDAMTGVIFGDDSSVVSLIAHKLYGNPGATIAARSLAP